MRSFLLLYLACWLVQITGCSKDEQPGFDQIINPLWEHNLGALTSGITPIVHGDKVLVSKRIIPGDFTSNKKLIALDKETGETLWEWSDHFETTFQGFDDDSTKPILNNVMAATVGGRNFAIDLANGQTLWKNRNTETTSRSNLAVLGDRLFRTDIFDLEQSGEYKERIMEADFFIGDWKPVFEISGGDSIRQGLEVPSFYLEDDGDTIMIISNVLNNFDKRVIVPRLISYNKTKKETYYDILLDEPSIGNAIDGFPVIDGERVYVAVDDLLVCHNVITSERIWERPLNANLLFSGFILVDNRIYANSEGSNPILYCIDAFTGSIIWQISSAGTSSPLQFYEGKLYYVGGNTALMHIVDANTGDRLADIRAPSSYENSNDFFSTRITIDQETGKIYVMSQSRAYCYPPLE